jgi:hypothetical protein
MFVNLKDNVNSHAVLFVEMNETHDVRGECFRFLVHEYFGHPVPIITLIETNMGYNTNAMILKAIIVHV